ncbi:MAG: hypothetical protein ABSG93_10870 [Solirubrobacteraceae bacterium]|jgi:hypothetical protein
MIPLRRVEEMQAEARYHRERYELYKAKSYGPTLTSVKRLKELERRFQGANSRLRSAERENSNPEPPDEPE